MRRAPSDPVFARQALQLIKLASLAPSRNNTQPWLFSIEDHAIRICPDYRRSLPVADPFHRDLHVALGCALENLLIGATSNGLHPHLTTFPDDNHPGSLLVHLGKRARAADPPDPEILSAVAMRQTNRSFYSGQKLHVRDLQTLVAASRQPGIQCGLLTEKEQIETISDFAGATGRDQATSDFLIELLDWIRFSRAEAERLGDGIRAASFGYPPMPGWLGRRVYSRHLRISTGTRLAERRVLSSSAMLVLVVEKDAPESWVNAGRSYQRLALTATVAKMSCAPVTLRSRLIRDYLGLSSEQPVLVARLGYARRTAGSIRRPLHDLVLVNETAVQTRPNVRSARKVDAEYESMMGLPTHSHLGRMLAESGRK